MRKTYWVNLRMGACCSWCSCCSWSILMAISMAICSATSRADGPVTITLEHFGVGDHFRSGDIVAARFLLQGQLDQPTTIELSWELPDGNGDISLINRQLVLGPGQPISTWLYARIPGTTVALKALDAIYTVRVWEKVNDRRTRELGSARISPATSANTTVSVDLTDDIFGVVGSGRMGLDAFSTVRPGTSYISSMNSITKIARGIRPQDLPDRWEGLCQFSAIIWSEGSPQSLSGDAAKALREWITRGGLFVVILPENADPWGVAAPSRHPLSDLMPDWKVERVEAVSIVDLLPALSQSNQIANPSATMPVHFFLAPGKNKAFQPLVLLPVHRVRSTGFADPRPNSLDGKILGVTRALGHGRITVIGLDVDALYRRALQSTGLPQADIFWNRILARRADTPTPQQFKDLENSKLFVQSAGTSIDLGGGELISPVIGMRGESAVGILGAFLLFVTYWTIAGPGGFGILKWLGRERHSWMLFVVTAIVFGASIWIIGSLVNSGRVRIQHLTVLDLIARSSSNQAADDPQLARATSWFSAFLPGYGQTTITVDAENQRRNILTGWSSPSSPSSTFPNPARIAVPLDKPGTLQAAARATSANFEARWLGIVPSKWGKAPFMPDPKRSLEQTVVAGDPIKVMLTGLIEHTLPGPLHDVGIIHITPIRNPSPVADLNGVYDPSAALPNIGRFKVKATWQPNDPIELSDWLYPGGPMGIDETVGDLQNAIRVRFQTPFKQNPLRLPLGQYGNQLGGTITDQQRQTFLDMLGMYNMLQPPQYFGAAGDDVIRVQRMLGRSCDISQWFTTPCLIVWGYLDAASCPVPLEIGGVEVPSTGMVLVRVVFPLPLDERFAAPPSD